MQVPILERHENGRKLARHPRDCDSLVRDGFSEAEYIDAIGIDPAVTPILGVALRSSMPHPLHDGGLHVRLHRR